MTLWSKEMAKQKPMSKIDATNMDLISALELIEELNKRVYDLEVKHENEVKLYNLTTNTINYILASLYVYESYLSEMGADQETLKKEIEQTFYDAFNRTGKKGSKPDYSESIIKKVNDKLREFQERVNQDA